MSEPIYSYDWTPGRLRKDHPALECTEPYCEGGQVAVQLPAGITDLEPRYRFEACEACEGQGYQPFQECAHCGADLEPLWKPVGAVVMVAAPKRPDWLYLLCGACAWEETLAD